MNAEPDFIRKCEALGYTQVRDNLATGKYRDRKAIWAHNWVDKLDRARAQNAEAQATSIARSSAESSRDQAGAAREANWISKLALIVAILALIVAFFKP